MVLYDENKIRLKVDDDGGVDRFSKITFLCEKPGIYYIYLYETGSDETGDYKLELTAEGGSIPTPPPAIDKDEFEPDNEMDSAQTVDMTTGLLKQVHTLDNSNDIDYFKVILKEKQKIYIETHKNKIETDTIIQVVSSDGKQVAYNADGGEGAYSLLEWSAPSSGTWYIRVKTYPDDSLGDYLIDIKDITPPAVVMDKYEDDNAKENAREIFPGIAQNRSICELGDIDWIRFEIKKGDAVRISTTSDWGDVFEHYLYLELYDSKNNLKASAEDYGAELTLDWECDETGTFYIKVYEYYETEVLDYKLLLEKK